MKTSVVVGFVAAALFAGVSSAQNAVWADDAHINAVRQALEKYRDPYVAVRDLYLPTVARVHYDGSSEEGHPNCPNGAIGVHFVNLTIRGPLDPMKPNVLIYEPKGGKLNLVAAEWLVPIADAEKHPEQFGQKFQGSMEGHEPPQAATHRQISVSCFSGVFKKFVLPSLAVWH